MVSESFAALLLEPNSLLVMMGPFPGVSLCGKSVWPKPSTHCSQAAPGKAAQWCLVAVTLCWSPLSLTGVTPVWHQCETSVALSLSQPVTPGQAEEDRGTEAVFPPRVFATGTRRFEVVWVSLVVPQGSALPNKCWWLKQSTSFKFWNFSHNFKTEKTVVRV